MLKEALEAELAMKSVILREPTRTGEYGKEIRQILAGNDEVDEKLSAYLRELFFKDRLFNVSEQVKPSIEQGAIVLQDRYFYSTAAYQAHNLSDIINILNEYEDTSIFKRPDIIFYLNLDPGISMRRMMSSRDSHDIFEYKEQLIRIYENYNLIWSELPPDNLVIIDAALPQKEVFSIVYNQIVSFITGV